MKLRLKFDELFLYESSHIAVSRSLLTESYPEHGHDFTEVVLAVSGEGIESIDGRDHAVGPGSVSVIKGRERHGFSKCRNLELYNFIMYGEDMALLLADLRGLAGYQYLFVIEPGRREVAVSAPETGPSGSGLSMRLSGTELEWARDAAAAMLREYERAEPGFQAAVKGGFLQLATTICRSFGRPSSAQTGSLRRLGAALGVALAYMEAHYTEHLEVGRLASMCGLSARHFQRLFKELCGTTVVERIAALRLGRAKALLRRSGLGVTEVALRCGYSDSNYFSRIFRAATGLTPTAFRAAP